MRYRDYDITLRTAEEVSKLGSTPVEIAKLIGCPAQVVRSWLNGEFTPSAHYLRRFHEVGCDVLYILTGTHYNLLGGEIHARPKSN